MWVGRGYEKYLYFPLNLTVEPKTALKKKCLFKSLKSGLQCGDQFVVKARGIHCSLSRLFIVVRKGHVAGCFLHTLQARALWEPCGGGGCREGTSEPGAAILSWHQEQSLLREKAKLRKETQRESESEKETRQGCQGLSFWLQFGLKLSYSWAFQRIHFSLSDYPGFLSLVNPRACVP